MPAIGRRIAVLIPTTTELLSIGGLVERPRLPRSHVVSAGDFRSLSISGDYHQLVSGPLQSVAALPGSVELRLSGDIDCGRSWELPVCLAHAVYADGRFTGTAAAADIIVWATGAVDSELGLVRDNYEITRKLTVSLAELGRLAGSGKDVLVLLPRWTPEPDKERAAARLDGLPASIRFVESLAEALEAIGIGLRTPTPQISAAAAEVTEPVRVEWKKPLFLLACTLAVAAIAFSLSTYHRNRETGGTVLESVQVLELHAADRGACIAATMSGEQLASRPATRLSDGFLAGAEGSLCGLRFANAGRRPVQLNLDSGLKAHTILGGSPLFQGLDLDGGRHIDLLFAREAAGAETILTVKDGDAISSVRLRIGSEG